MLKDIVKYPKVFFPTFFPATLMVSNFVTLQFVAIFAKFCDREKSQNHKIVKSNTCRLWDFLFPNIWLKYDIDTGISHISSYRNKIRVSVIYLLTVALINNRKIDIQWDFCFLLLLKSRY